MPTPRSVKSPPSASSPSLQPETLTIGKIVSDMRPSHLWAVVIALGGLTAVSFQLGSWVAATLPDDATDASPKGSSPATASPDTTPDSGKEEEGALPAILHPTARAEGVALELVESLEERLASQAARIEKEGDGWLLGQMLLCHRGLQVQVALNRLASMMDSECGCWHRLAGSNPGAFHNAASFWSLIGLVSSRDARAVVGLKYLLSDQAMNGSWSMYPRRAHENVKPSTYATALALLALSYAMNLQVGVDPAPEQVSEAVKKGTRWLLETSERGLWRDYPGEGTGTLSPSISALVLHVLHRLADRGWVARNSLSSLDRHWINALPAKAFNATDMEARSETWVAEGHPDDVFQAPAAWMLVGARDTYASATAEQRRRLISLVSDVLERSDFPQEVMVLDWRVCEFVLGTRYLLGQLSF